MSLIVTIDGPSGTGKSTVSRKVAELAGLPHLDTGAFYRALTLAALRSHRPLTPDSLAELARNTRLHQAEGRMFLDDEDVTSEIRNEEVTASVSEVAAVPEVRSVLVALQRRWVANRGGRAVVEGRDIGSVVFPDADVKIYLDARPEVRAERRARETGEAVGEVLEDIVRRDAHDSGRESSPLQIPLGAALIDTSDLSFVEVVSEVMRHIAAKV